MILTIDIETLPASESRLIERIAQKVKAPGTMKKAETIAKWEAEEKPAAIEEAVAKTGLNGLYGSVLCIGAKLDDNETLCFCGPTERDTLCDFSTWIMSMPSHEVMPLTVVGHNVVNFDLRFLYHRYCINQVKLPPYIQFHARPWDTSVFDTMVKWAGVGSFVSLDDLCFAFGMEGKGDIDGSKVAEYYRAGRIDEIIQYCKDDVDKTYQVYKRMQ